MLKLLKSASPEDVFVQRYDQLLGWALSITNHNQEQAEDLVHDAFIQFTHRRGDLAAIENTDAYLNRMLRNMYLSQVRRAGLIQESRFSIADFDSVEMGLRSFRASDPREHLDLQDEIRQICQYACARKQSSKVGSVLILRFFHGYYPSELVQVLRTTRMAIDRYLQISRREAKTYLADPGALKFISESRSASPAALGYARTMPELLSELRQTIVATRQGECLSKAELKEHYRGSASIDGGLLSHLVSCPRCLDTVNQLLGLPLLAERSSDDRLGRDVPPDKSGGGGAGGAGSSIMESKKRYQRREKEVMEHRPQELRIAVNGFVLGAQQIGSELSKLALTVNVDEPIGFVEVFSEQGVRLLFLDVDQPTDGGIEQAAGVDFDCGRSLDLSLSFRGPWPAVNLSYLDPAFEAVNSTTDLDSKASPEPVLEHSKSEVSTRTTFWPESLARVRSVLGKFDLRMLLRPGPVTALISVLLLIGIVLLYRQVPTAPISAADLLSRAATAEDVAAANRDQVLHRTISLEVSVPRAVATGAGPQLIARNKIEIWQSGEKGITARRLFDEKGNLVAGDWRRADGVQTLYAHSQKPQLQLAPDKRGITGGLTFESVWQLSPSAKEFTALVGRTDGMHLEEQTNAYVITYSRGASSAPGLVRTTLVLSRSDLRPTEQSLIIQQGNEQREFRFVETAYERRPTIDVAPSVFEPDAELLSSSQLDTTELETRDSKPETSTPPTPAASAALEVELLERLNQANAFLGEQITVSRSADGQLRVEGVVDTSARKAEIVRALGPLMKNPSVRVGIDTVAEAQARQSQRGQQPSTVTLEGVQVTEERIAVDAELRRYLQSRGLSGDQLEVEIRRFTDRVLQKSLQARLHARALKQIADRFSAAQLDTLDSDARARWRGMISQHARACRQDIESLRRELQPLFPSLGGVATSEQSITSDDALLQAIARLYSLSVTNDESLRKSFSLYAGGAGDAPIRSAQFWRSLASAENLAERIISR